jgi:diguanylate cyclase (GGDEF)-like protein
MICQEEFAQFVKVLSSQENTFMVSQRAISFIADLYHIGRVSAHLEVESSAFTPGGDSGTKVVYEAEEVAVEEEPGFEKEFWTGENGRVRIRMYSLENQPAWSEEDKTDLDVVSDVLFFHLGRCRLIRQVQKNALTDFMTGLPNADGYMRYANKLFAKNHGLSAYNSYYINLKGFGLVNRKFGQKEADEVIKRYARILKSFTEGEECVGRLGGDNFVALIRKERTQEFLQLLSSVTTYGIVAGDRIPVVLKAVAGVLEIDDTLENCEPIISKCAVALNVAKNVLKKPFLFATKEIDERVFRQKQVTERFPEALENEEFKVYYQPKVETNSYMIVGAEALVRWISDGKLINPGEFIPVIEQDGAVCKLDFYMLEHVCQDIRNWISMGIKPVRISVNFSRKHLSNPNFSEDIMRVIEKYDVPVRYIEIEVTETVDEEEQGLLGDFMRKMREYEIATAIDDFGTGYSSFNLLRSFPIDVLKIDKSFIDDESLTENDSIVLSNIVKMAKELNMDVVTEGVENWDQVEFLQGIHCNVVQGFVFDRPMPGEKFEKKLQGKRYAGHNGKMALR